MIGRAREPRGVMLFTALIALIFQVVPLPEIIAPARPAFVVMVALYWSIAAPRAGGIGLGFLSGLALDVFEGAVLGQHALAISLITYLAISFHLQLRNKPLFQQSLFTFAALAIYEFVVYAIDGWTGHPLSNPLRWVHPVTGAIFWPVLVLFLSRTHAAR